MEEISKERIQKFWESVGFKFFAKGHRYVMWPENMWLYPDKTWQDNPPPIDLNNLFEYACRNSMLGQ